ncbi:MAG: methylmalonyl Co-A mutase-associated GTPase MeaB, partial [Marivita lacus]|nr:methylmalonyl Co-A mutase-associated GTPase MeaB [Marivita lacus]
AWQEMQTLTDWRREQGHFAARRAGQARFWFEAELKQSLLARLEREPMKGLVQSLGRAVEEGLKTPSQAADEVLAQLEGRIPTVA